MLTSEIRRALQVARARYSDDETITSAAALVEEQDAAIDARRAELEAEGNLTPQGIDAELKTLREEHTAARAKLVADQKKRVERLSAAATKSTPAPIEIEPHMRDRLLQSFLDLPRDERTRAAVSLKDNPRLATVIAGIHDEDRRHLGIPDAVYQRAQSIARGATHDPATGRDVLPNQTDIDNLQSAQKRMQVVERLTSL